MDWKSETSFFDGVRYASIMLNIMDENYKRPMFPSWYVQFYVSYLKWINSSKLKKGLHLNMLYLCLFVCLFVCLFGVFRHFDNFPPLWRRHHYHWRAANYFDLYSDLYDLYFDLYSASIATEQWGFSNVPHLLWRGSNLYNCQFRGPVTLSPIAERLAGSFHYLF